LRAAKRPYVYFRYVVKLRTSSGHTASPLHSRRVFEKGQSPFLAMTVMVLVVSTTIMGLAFSPHLSHFSAVQFLVQRGTAKTDSVFFYPLNGFVGNVTLDAEVSPSLSSAPSVSFDPSIITLNASLQASTMSTLRVDTTNSTDLGVYSITMTGSSGSISHSATVVVGVTRLSVPVGGAELLYSAHFTTLAYAGNSTLLESRFEDLGYATIGITNLRIGIDFGTYSYPPPPSACPPTPSGGCQSAVPFLKVQPYGISTFDLTIQIPNFTAVGNHMISADVSWVINPGLNLEQRAPDLVTNGSLIVYSKPNPTPENGSTAPTVLARLLVPILGVSAIVVLAIGLAIRRTGRPEKVSPEMLQYVRSAKQSLTQKRCSKCGASESSEAKFCGTCGNPLT